MSKMTFDKAMELYDRLKNHLEVLETITQIPLEHATKKDRYTNLPIGKTKCNTFLWGRWNPQGRNKPSISEFIKMYNIEVVKS